MSEKAHNIEQPFQAKTSLETNEDITLIKGALGRLHAGCQKHGKELIEARNLSTRLKGESAELKSERDELTQNNSILKLAQTELKKQLQTTTEKLTEKEAQHSEELSGLQNQLVEHAGNMHELEQNLQEQLKLVVAENESEKVQLQELQKKLDEQAKELGRQAKGNHDLNLSLMEKDNQHNAFKKQAKKKIAELTEASKTVDQMRKMLGGFQAPAETTAETTSAEEKSTASNDEDITKAAEAPQSMEDSFEQWLNPAGTKNKNFSLLED